MGFFLKLKKNKIKQNKRGDIWTAELVWWFIAIIFLVIAVVLLIILFKKGSSAFDFIKNILRFKR